jgi:hypothetical protein
MSREETLRKVAYDVQQGDLGKARDRLHGLIHAYPDDLMLREKLAGVYWQLQQPAMAGRYWYLSDSDAPEVREAREAFACAHGSEPLLMLQALKFRGNPERLKGTPAGKRFDALVEAVEKSHGPQTAQRYSGKPYSLGEDQPLRQTWQEKVGCACLLLVALFLLALMGIGFGVVVEWLF